MIMKKIAKIRYNQSITNASNLNIPIIKLIQIDGKYLYIVCPATKYIYVISKEYYKIMVR